MSPRMGRPKAENPKTDRLVLRVTPDEKRTVQEFCKSTKHSLLDLVRAGMEVLAEKKK